MLYAYTRYFVIFIFIINQVQNEVKTSTTVNIWDSSKIDFSMPPNTNTTSSAEAKNTNRLIIDVSNQCNAWVTSNVTTDQQRLGDQCNAWVTNSFSCNGFSSGLPTSVSGISPFTAEFTQSNMPAVGKASPTSQSRDAAAARTIVAVANRGFTKPPLSSTTTSAKTGAAAKAAASTRDTAGGEDQYESDFESESGGDIASTAAGTSPGASLSPGTRRARQRAQVGDKDEERVALAAARREIKSGAAKTQGSSLSMAFFSERLKSAVSGETRGEDLLARSKT